jgi:hypothetical protein
VNSKLNSLRSGVNESLKVQISTIKQNNEVLSQTSVEHRSNTADSMGEIRQEISTLKQERLYNKLNNHKKEVGSKFENIQAEIVNLRHGVIVDKFCELETKIEELLDSRLAKVECQLDKFCGQGTPMHSANLQSSADGVRGTNGGHTGAIPTSVPPAMSQFLSNRRHDNCNNDDCVHVHAQTAANKGVSELSHVNDLVPGFGHFHSSVTSDLALLKFNDCKKQNIVNFLEELDSYFQLKNVPAEIKLPIAMKAITEEYTQQWVTTIYKELRNYEQIKQAITELLWSPKIQSQVRCSIYQDRFNKSGGECLSAHFLRYAMMTANLTRKMSELEVIDAVSGHYPNYVQRALVSANVKNSSRSLKLLKQTANNGGRRSKTKFEP